MVLQRRPRLGVGYAIELVVPDRFQYFLGEFDRIGGADDVDGAAAEATLMKRLRDCLNRSGTLQVIRNGFDVLGLRRPLKMAQFNGVTFNPSFELAVRCMQVEAVPPRDQLHRLLQILPKLIGVGCFTRVAACDCQTASQIPTVRFEATDIIALPAMNGDAILL